MQRIKKGDTVEVIAGSDKGARGEVLNVLPKEDRVVIERVNIVKKHQRPVSAGRQQVQPGIIEYEAPIHLSNVMLVCPQCDKPTRVGYRVNEDGTKVRVCRACASDID
ncbi:MAG TPA: 50S ribosomal protein L24 [Aggregatilinea sp.]|jgi:large subunit ribosomal protein L24|uniref:50S ribosomal protein L24 n=1 Tax=Aggregatilinea sp. TaxID=2806333 RepID=UPI002CDF285F|nr:50S ribosomal protein L24 [Aggregatilinea sp.]HML22134.1 50S ribosomal protein L24 [Aggregatilinea sp.]